MFLKKYWIFILAIIYILLPVDLVPDVIPFFGGMDDSTMVILGLVKQYLDAKKKKNGSNGV